MSDVQNGETASNPVVIELRTHGVSGTPPESMLNCAAVVQVSGDETGRFFRAADSLGEPIWQVAPVDTGDGRSVTRYREGYHWGKMTSGGLKQALWGLLVPFALVNLAQWMVPPPTAKDRFALLEVLRGVVRVVGVGLTVVLVVQWTTLVAHVVGVQCLRPAETEGEPACLSSWPVVDLVRGHPLPITVLVLIAVTAPVAIGTWITAQSRKRIGADSPQPAGSDGKRASEAARREVDEAKTRPVPNIGKSEFLERHTTEPMRALHAAVGLSSAALVLSGGWRPLPGVWPTATWGASAALVCVGVVLAFFMDDPSGSGGRFHRGRWVNRALAGRPWVRLVIALVTGAVLVAAAFLGYLPMTSGSPSGGQINELVQWLFVILAGLCALVAALTWWAARQSRNEYFSRSAATKGAFRPWARGMATAVVLPFAVLLGAGLGVGMAETARNCLRTSCKPALLSNPGESARLVEIDLPTSYQAVALLWGITGTVVGIAVIALVVGGPAYARRSTRLAPAQRVQRGDGSQRTTWMYAGLKLYADRILFGVVVVAVTAGLISALAMPTGPMIHVVEWSWVEWPRRAARIEWFARQTDAVAVLQSAGVFVLALIAIGLLYAIYNAYRRPDTAGRSLGVLWDLASFWPTEAHPWVPPCYARKAVGDLVERVRMHCTESPDARIVLCGHSQGSLLMYATVLRLAEPGKGISTEDLKRIGLVTHGSQLQWAYGRAFPDLLSYFSHVLVMDTLEGRWQNLVRYTDPLGGAVLSWEMRICPDESLCGEALPLQRRPDDGLITERRADEMPSGAWVIGNERWLPDPVLADPLQHEPRFPARAHSDYTLDAQWDAAIASAAGFPPHPDYPPPPGLSSTE